MYVPSHFRETDTGRLFDVIDAHPFASLVGVLDGAPFVTHLPFLLDREAAVLYGHLAGANPHGRILFDRAPALAVFQGAHAYISPRWYVNPNVPTWNYLAVHVYGQPRRLDADELHALLERLSARFEDPADPWTPAQVPAQMLHKLERAIVGFAIPIERIEGKFKLGQNRAGEDRLGACAALAEHGEHELAELMRATVDS